MIIKRRRKRIPPKNLSQSIYSRNGLNHYSKNVPMMMKLEFNMKKNMAKNLRILLRHIEYL